jgi:hypothetical protein
MRYAKGAIAALTCALVLIPAGVAAAGTGPAATPAHKAAKAVSTAPSAEGNVHSARAQAAGLCSDAVQIGETGYITSPNGDTMASVKEFYSPSCNEDYGYLWVWDSFLRTGEYYDASIGVFDYDQDKTVGQESIPSSRNQEFWSHGVVTTGDCTAGVGSLRINGEPLVQMGISTQDC